MPSAPHHSSSTSALRDAFASFATGVTVVTTRDQQGKGIGLTVNSFSSVSLTPPLIQWSLRLSSGLHPVFSAASHFSISVLNAGQEKIARQFASAVPDRFAGIELIGPDSEPPLLAGALAHFYCRKVASHTVGDHDLIIGEVVYSRTHGGLPLVFHDHRFLTLCP